MEDNRTPTKGEQGRIDVCENITNWASGDMEHRGCIVLATDEQSSTCGLVGCSHNLIMALASAIKSTPELREILSTALMFDNIVGGSKNNPDKD